MDPHPPSPRSRGLDSARGVAVVAMVVGHTLDALLVHQARQTPLGQTYWTLRGATAPMFLLLAGWSLVASDTRRGGKGLTLLTRRIPRAALLLACGFALRWPTWDVPGLLQGSPKVLTHFFASDALHCIAFSLLCGAAVCATVSRPLPRGAALLALAVAAAATAPLAATAFSAPGAPFLARQWLAGGSSPFPLLPWAGYFFAGALFGLVFPRPDDRRAPAALAIAGALLVASALVAGVDWHPSLRPSLFVGRLGLALSFSSLALLLPSIARRGLAPLGRTSLAMYLVHLVLVYGWGPWHGLATQPGAVLGPLAALGASFAVLGASAAVAVGATWLRARARGTAGGAPMVARAAGEP